MNNQYTYSLNDKEIIFSAGLMNIDAIPLPFRQEQPEVGRLAESTQSPARDSLVQKKLLQLGSDGIWQMDPVLIETLLWLANPRFALLLKTCRRDGTSAKMGVYRRRTGDLFATIEPEQIVFTLYEEQSGVFDELLARGGVANQYWLAQPLLLRKPSGFQFPADCGALFQHCPDLQYASFFRLIIGDDIELRCASETCLVGNMDNLWLYTPGVPAGLGNFEAVTADQARHRISQVR